MKHPWPTKHSWADCLSNPANEHRRGQIKADILREKNARERSNGGGNSGRLANLEAQLATQKALLQVTKQKQANTSPSAASAKATLASIMENEDIDAKEAALIELAQTLSVMPVNGGGSPSCYFVATALTSELSGGPILDSGASTTFVTSDDYLTNPRKHRTSIATANGQGSFTKSAGK